MFIDVDFMLGGNINSGGYSLDMRWMLTPSIFWAPAVGPSTGGCLDYSVCIGGSDIEQRWSKNTASIAEHCTITHVNNDKLYDRL